MEEILKKIDIKKVGHVGLLIASVVATYYGLLMYKTHLEIKILKKNLNE
jgi:hypothetical protein